MAARRGVLGPWGETKAGRIENYQCVVPTTWNGIPGDAKGQIGACEASLMNTPMVNPEQPVEILRTLHSFDNWRGTWRRLAICKPAAGSAAGTTSLGAA